MKEHFESVEDFILDPGFKSWVIEPTQESNEFWQVWLNNNPERREMFLIAKEVVQGMQFKEFDATGEIKDRVLDSILKNHGIKYKAKDRKALRVPVKLLVRIAAVVVLAACIYVISRYEDSRPIPTPVVESLTQKNNPAGRKSQVFLPDGSIVWLNSASSLEYVTNFTRDKRIVKLKGEAYFDVVKDPSRPFIVESTGMSIRALGTAFNVKAFEEDQDVKVVLVEGRVRIEHPADQDTALATTFLDPGEYLLFNKLDQNTTKGKANVDATMAWKNGVIHFERASLSEVIAKLERWYGVHFEIENESNKGPWDYSAEFDNQSLESVLKSLGFTKNFKYEMHKDTVTIKF